MEEPIENQATTTPRPNECYTCLTPLKGDEKVCAECGCPIYGSAAEIDKHRSSYVHLREQYQSCMQEALTATKSLYWLAGLSFVGNITIGLIKDTPSNYIAAFVVPAIFIPLALWSRTKPYEALLTATVLYILIILADAIYAPKSLAQGLIVKIIIITYLVKGIRAGKDSKRLWDKLKDKHWIQPF
jgi:hypothetical protein